MNLANSTFFDTINALNACIESLGVQYVFLIHIGEFCLHSFKNTRIVLGDRLMVGHQVLVLSI